MAGAASHIFVGRWLGGYSRQTTASRTRSCQADALLVTFANTATYYAIWLIAIMAALVFLGVPVQTVLLIAAAVMVVLGIALQESLRDLAATVNFLLFKHFEPGDTIETNGVVGWSKRSSC